MVCCTCELHKLKKRIVNKIYIHGYIIKRVSSRCVFLLIERKKKMPGILSKLDKRASRWYFYATAIPPNENNIINNVQNDFLNDHIKRMDFSNLPILVDHKRYNFVGKAVWSFFSPRLGQVFGGYVDLSNPKKRALYLENIASGKMVEISLTSLFVSARDEKTGIEHQKKALIELSFVEKGNRKGCFLLHGMTDIELEQKKEEFRYKFESDKNMLSNPRDPLLFLFGTDRKENMNTLPPQKDPLAPSGATAMAGNPPTGTGTGRQDVVVPPTNNPPATSAGVPPATNNTVASQQTPAGTPLAQPNDGRQQPGVLVPPSREELMKITHEELVDLVHQSTQQIQKERDARSLVEEKSKKLEHTAAQLEAQVNRSKNEILASMIDSWKRRGIVAKDEDVSEFTSIIEGLYKDMPLEQKQDYNKVFTTIQRNSLAFEHELEKQKQQYEERLAQYSNPKLESKEDPSLSRASQIRDFILGGSGPIRNKGFNDRFTPYGDQRTTTFQQETRTQAYSVPMPASQSYVPPLQQQQSYAPPPPQQQLQIPYIPQQPQPTPSQQQQYTEEWIRSVTPQKGDPLYGMAAKAGRQYAELMKETGGLAMDPLRMMKQYINAAPEQYVASRDN